MQVKIPWEDENIDQFINGLVDNVRFFFVPSDVERCFIEFRLI